MSVFKAHFGPFYRSSASRFNTHLSSAAPWRGEEREAASLWSCRCVFFLSIQIKRWWMDFFQNMLIRRTVGSVSGGVAAAWMMTCSSFEGAKGGGLHIFPLFDTLE